jgi:hypothetical protein
MLNWKISGRKQSRSSRGTGIYLKCPNNTTKNDQDSSWFDPGSGQVGFVVNKVALEQVFSEYFGFPCQSSFHQLLHNHPQLSSGAGTIGQKWPQYKGLSPTPLAIKKIRFVERSLLMQLLWPGKAALRSPVQVQVTYFRSHCIILTCLKQIDINEIDTETIIKTHNHIGHLPCASSH